MVPHSGLPSARTHLIVFAALGALTGLNVGLSYLPIAHQAGLAGKTVIATMQAGVMAHFLMHLRGENRCVTYLMLIALFLLVALIGTLIPDIGIVHR